MKHGVLKTMKALGDGSYTESYGEDTARIVANSIWEHAVPDIRTHLAELKDVLLVLHNDLDLHNESDVSTLIEQDIDEWETALCTLKKSYPEPHSVVIQDHIDIVSYWPMLMVKATFVYSLPDKPLTLKSPMSEMTLVYEALDGELFKVANIWYNQPTKRTIKVY